MNLIIWSMCTQSVIVVKLPTHLEKGSETHTYDLSCRVHGEPLFWLLSVWLAWLAPSVNIWNLVLFDQDMFFDSHIEHNSTSAFYHLLNITIVRQFLSQHYAEKSVYIFNYSRLNYCNSLSSGWLMEAPEYCYSGTNNHENRSHLFNIGFSIGCL